MRSNILVVPAEGDSVETEQLYVNDLIQHYDLAPQQVKVLDFFGNYQGVAQIIAMFCDCEPSIARTLGKNLSTAAQAIIDIFFEKDDGSSNYEVHAQGGFGAYLAYLMLSYHPERLDRVFFIGGAPSDAMMFYQKWFHRSFSKFWYATKIPFFADDPNPYHDPKIASIKASSTATMRANPWLYREQLILIGTWTIQDPRWRPKVPCYFVPNGKTVRAAWLDNSYDNEKASEIWGKHGVKTTGRPEQNFSFYSMMPSEALFKVMDKTIAL